MSQESYRKYTVLRQGTGGLSRMKERQGPGTKNECKFLRDKYRGGLYVSRGALTVLVYAWEAQPRRSKGELP